MHQAYITIVNILCHLCDDRLSINVLDLGDIFYPNNLLLVINSLIQEHILLSDSNLLHTCNNRFNKK